MLKKLLPLVVLVFWPCYSYSDSIQPYYGTTGNAASGGYSWSMDTILPTPPGLDINGVIYNYTIQKDVDDSVDVHVQNENALGTGYIFKETDSWLPGSLGGTEIRKVVPVIPDIPRSAWGNGSIEVEGNGTVDNANVVYMYKVDPCYDPQFDPNCPGYQVPMPPVVEINIEIYDVTQDDNVKLSSEEQVLIEANEEQLDKEKEEEEKEAEERLRKYRLERAMSASDASAIFAENIRIQQMNAVVQFAVNSQYLSATIPGGTYKETVVLKDGKIDDNKQGLRNGLAQQLLHEEMVQSQYK